MPAARFPYRHPQLSLGVPLAPPTLLFSVALVFPSQHLFTPWVSFHRFLIGSSDKASLEFLFPSLSGRRRWSGIRCLGRISPPGYLRILLSPSRLLVFCCRGPGRWEGPFFLSPQGGTSRERVLSRLGRSPSQYFRVFFFWFLHFF